jgi:ribosomal protein S18 acetylase RimI-like enzyme
MILRSATEADLEALGRLAGLLVRQHHDFDPNRFMLVDNVEGGYATWFRQELNNPNAVLLVADERGEIAGYAYGRLESRDWNALLEACGALHDLFVLERYRGQGMARALVRGMISELQARGAPRVVLHTATANEAAQRLFASLGFRSTMIEMTAEISEGSCPCSSRS